MALYKALTGDMKSPEGYGAPYGPWVKDQWYEVEGPVHFDPSGITNPPNGFRCSLDILQCMCAGVHTQYIAQVEIDGASVVYESNQWWKKMRVVSVKAWTPAKATLVLDWAEGRAHDVWEGRFVSEAALYDAAHYTGQFGTMLGIIEPVYKSLYNDNDFWRFPKWQQFNSLKPQYTRQFERLVKLAYMLALCLTGNLTPYGGASWVRYAEAARPGSWDIIKGFTEDHWAGLPEA